MKNKSVCIIILNLNGKEFTKNCLNSIKKNTEYKNYKVIVVDNASTDGSQKLVKEKFKWVDLIENEKNRGFAGGNNDGIKYAHKKYNPDYFYLLNNDTKVTKNWLRESVVVAEKDNKIGIVGSKQLSFEGEPTKSAGWLSLLGTKYYFGDDVKKVDWVMGNGMFIKKEVIKKIGYFDEKYNPAYYEEGDFEIRARKAKFEIFYSPKSLIYHKGGGTSTKIETDKLFYLMQKNRTLYFLKNYSFFYFLPRIIFDLYNAIKLKKLHLFLRAYKDGYKSLK